MDDEMRRFYQMSDRDRISRAVATNYGAGGEVVNMYSRNAVEVRISESRIIGSKELNNLKIVSDAICINDNASLYWESKDMVKDCNELEAVIDDEEGRWVRIKNSIRNETEGNEVEIIQEIAEESLVWVKFKHHGVSKEYDEEDILQIIGNIKNLHEQMLNQKGAIRKSEQEKWIRKVEE
jgi:hypothetical protein